MYEPAVVLEALCLTAAIVLGLTAYTFHAARKGHSFQKLGPFLFAGQQSTLLLYAYIAALVEQRRHECPHLAVDICLTRTPGLQVLAKVLRVQNAGRKCVDICQDDWTHLLDRVIVSCSADCDGDVELHPADLWRICRRPGEDGVCAAGSVALQRLHHLRHRAADLTP